jgi:hypothetical protein
MEDKLYREIVLTALKNATEVDGSVYYSAPFINEKAWALADKKFSGDSEKANSIVPTKTRLTLEQLFEGGTILRKQIRLNGEGQKRFLTGYLAKV